MHLCFLVSTFYVSTHYHCCSVLSLLALITQLQFQFVDTSYSCLISSDLLINVSNGGRKKVVVSVEKHLAALQTQDKGKTIERVAEELGIGHVIVGDWKRDGCKIENFCSDRPSNEELKDMQWKNVNTERCVKF